MQKKEAIFTFIFSLLVVFIYAIFPTENIYQMIFSVSLFFVIMPLLFNKFILKRTLGEMGFAVGDRKQGLFLSMISVFVASLILFISFKYFGMMDRYLLPDNVVENFVDFLQYEMLIVLGSVVVFEIFFRGLVMFSFIESLSWWSIVLQFLFFLLMVLSIGESFWSFFPFVVFAPFAGVIAFKSKSIFYSAGSQLIVIILFDSLIIHALR